jgi:hypothetical protein
MRRNTIKILLAVGDYAIMIGALSLMLLSRYDAANFPERFDQHLYTFLAIFFLWIVAFYVLEMYNINAPFNHRKFMVAMFANVAIAITFIYLFIDVVDITPRRNLSSYRCFTGGGLSSPGLSTPWRSPNLSQLSGPMSTRRNWRWRSTGRSGRGSG